MKIQRLIGNRLHVRRLRLANRSPGGIVYPDDPNWRDDKTQFEVLGVGPGKRLKSGELLPSEVAPGDHIFAPIYDDAQPLPDGTFIIDARLVQAKWRPA